MTRVHQILAASAAVGCLTALVVHLGRTEHAPVYADPAEALIDSDGDFLPDSVEWVVLTNANNPDTDGDGISDYVEVVQRGMPRQPGSMTALDHEMRVVMTGPSTPNAPTWLHVFFRFVDNAAQLSSFTCWLESNVYPGLQLPMNLLGTGSVIRQRSTPAEGQWLSISVPMVNEAMLRQILPCSIRAQATIGGAVVSASVKLLDVGGDVCSLVPYGDGRHVLQTIKVLPATLPVTNRVCLLTLEEAGSGTGGTLYEIVEANCESCNELECRTGCRQSVGWFVTVPGGVGEL